MNFIISNRGFLSLFTGTALMVGLWACGTETGNPEALVFEYNATSTEPGRVGLGSSEGGIAVETVWLRLADVSFRACDGEVKGSLEGLGFADHGGDEAAFQTLELPDTTFCSVETRLFTDDRVDTEPEEIAGAALALSGTTADGRTFQVVVESAIDLTIDLDDVRLPASGNWLLAFDVAAWVDALDLPEDEDPIVVDASRPERMSSFIEAIPSGVFIVEDRAGDGQVDFEDPRL